MRSCITQMIHKKIQSFAANLIQFSANRLIVFCVFSDSGEVCWWQRPCICYAKISRSSWLCSHSCWSLNQVWISSQTAIYCDQIIIYMEYLPFIMPDVWMSSLWHNRCTFTVFMDVLTLTSQTRTHPTN